MKLGYIEDWDTVMVVNIPENKTLIQNTIVDEKGFSVLPLLKLYMSFGPVSIERFF